MKGIKKIVYTVAFLLPALAFISVFLLYPFAKNIIRSFYISDGFNTGTFAGLDNYRRLIDDPTILTALGNTFELMVYVIIFELGIAILLAILVDSIKLGHNFFKTVFFFPIVISATAIGMMFKLFYTFRGGLLNTIMLAFHADPKVWVNKENALQMVSIPTIWQYVGFYFVIILTAIKQVPKELYESAYLDGITSFKKVIYITLPLIKNVLITCLILAMTGTLKVFDMVMVITQGGPMNGSQVLGLYMYEKTFTDEVVGYGATISVLIMFLGISLSIIVNKLFKHEDITY